MTLQKFVEIFKEENAQILQKMDAIAADTEESRAPAKGSVSKLTTKINEWTTQVEAQVQSIERKMKKRMKELEDRIGQIDYRQILDSKSFLSAAAAANKPQDFQLDNVRDRTGTGPTRASISVTDQKDHSNTHCSAASPPPPITTPTNFSTQGAQRLSRHCMMSCDQTTGGDDLMVFSNNKKQHSTQHE